MPGRVVAAVVSCAVALSGCAGDRTRALTGDERAEALERSAHAPREFTAIRTFGHAQFKVAGRVQDDYRYHAAVTVAGVDLYEEVDVDDQRFIRVLDPSAVPETLRAQPDLAPLVRGAWVRDGGRAPPEFPKPGTQPRVLDPTPVLEKVRYLEALHGHPTRAGRVKGATEYDPESVTYLKRDDKFPSHAADGRRFDTIPSAYDPNVVFRDGLPQDLQKALEPYALYLSYWIKGGRVTRIELFFDVDVERVTKDIRAAMERLADRTGLPVDASRIPPTPQPYRETYTFRYSDDPMTVDVPSPSATVTLPPLAVPVDAGAGQSSPTTPALTLPGVSE